MFKNCFKKFFASEWLNYFGRESRELCGIAITAFSLSSFWVLGYFREVLQNSNSDVLQQQTVLNIHIYLKELKK